MEIRAGSLASGACGPGKGTAAGGVRGRPELIEALEDDLLAERAVGALRSFAADAAPALVATLRQRHGESPPTGESRVSRRRRIAAATLLGVLGDPAAFAAVSKEATVDLHGVPAAVEPASPRWLIAFMLEHAGGEADVRGRRQVRRRRRGRSLRHVAGGHVRGQDDERPVRRGAAAAVGATPITAVPIRVTFGREE